MTLHPTMRRRIHERLHPLIGDEETDALLDEVSLPDPITRPWLEATFVTKEWAEDRFITKEWAEDRFVTKEHLDLKLDALGLDHRFGAIEDKFDAIDHRFESIDHRFEALDHRFEAIDHKFDAFDHKLVAMEERIMGAMHAALREQTRWTVGALVVVAAVLSIVSIVWG